MRTALFCALLLAALSASTEVAVAQTPGVIGSASAADFSGIGVGVDLAAAFGSASSWDTSGAVGGLHAGYNLQNGPLVGGVEGDILLGSVQGNVLDGGTFSQDFLTTAGIKGGYAFGSLLGYGTLGWAWSTSDYSDLGSTSSRSLNGWTYGIGAEFEFSRAISVRAELQRYDFGGASYATPLGTRELTTSTNLVRLGLTTRF